MKDPYLYPQTNTLINLFGEKVEQRLDEIEANYTGLRLRQLIDIPICGNFDFTHLCAIHRFIFQDIFEWAGIPRTVNIEKPESALGGMSVEYTDFQNIETEAIIACSKLNDIDWSVLGDEQKAETVARCMSGVWKIHPFREGNTRTVLTFICDFVDYKGFPLNRDIFKDNSVFVRRALVAANAVFHDIGDLSQPQHLIRIIFDAINNGL
jgi:cell filamentation protein